MSASVHNVTARQQSQYTIENIEGDFPLDRAVAKAVPAECKIIAANSFGHSAWTVTARIDTQRVDGTPQIFFLKCATEDAGRQMMEGEYNAMCEIYRALPSFAPKPYTWGQFMLPDPPTSFFLCEFIDMDTRLPNPAKFAVSLAKLHTTSKSPTGQFGFHIPTCHGRYPQRVGWQTSWASFFKELLRGALELDKLNNESWPELDRVSDRVLTHVVPRLLGALQSNGRSIKPALIHGDLWEGNIGTSFETGEIVIFDAGAYYAHNEMEIGMWRCTRHRINSKVFFREYLRNVPPSEPAEEWDDRNRLYCVKMNMVHSGHHKGDIVRQTSYDDMCYLVDKYAPWSENGSRGAE